MKRTFLAAVAVLAMACGGGGPTAPSPKPQPLPQPTLVPFGQFLQSQCLNISCSYGEFQIRNDGPGCARTTDLAGTLVAINATGQTVGRADWELTLGWKTAGILRPGDVAKAITTTEMPWLTGTNDIRVTVTRQTTVGCN